MTKNSKNYVFSLIRNIATTITTTILFGFMLTACLGEDPFEKQRKADESTIRAYVADKKLQGSFTASGLYYDTITNDRIKNQRVVRVTENSIVQISYKLTDLQGILLQKTDSTYFFQPSVGAFFSGLAEGILLTRKGQNAIFIIPSLLALGSQARTVGGVSVAPNSCLRLEVTVHEVRTQTEQDVYENKLIKTHIIENKRTITQDSSEVVFVRTSAPILTGARFKIGDNVKITYEGRRLDGTTFDKGTLPSIGTAPLQGYIKGFMTGITMMREGETGFIYMNSSAAYGAAGTSGKIAPFAPLVFEITALSR